MYITVQLYAASLFQVTVLACLFVGVKRNPGMANSGGAVHWGSEWLEYCSYGYQLPGQLFLQILHCNLQIQTNQVYCAPGWYNKLFKNSDKQPFKKDRGLIFMHW